MPKESNLAMLKQIFTPKRKLETRKNETTPPPTLPPTPCSLRSTSHSVMGEAPPVYDDASFMTLCDDYPEDDGMDIDAYINSIAKAPEEEEGFGEYGYEGLWLWPSEIAKFKSTTLDAYLDERRAKENDQTTHTSYVGGKWFIPIVENNLFLSLYFRDCIRNGSICFFSERQLRWKKFRFILDWDMDPSPYNAFISRNGMDSITFDRHFAGVIVRALGHLSPAPSFMYAKNPDIPSKIHVYFSRLVRTAEMGNEWLALIRDEFIQTFVTDDSENWEKIFDAAVLQNGRASLRMLGSHSRKRNGVYKVLDLISGEFEDITPIHLAGSIFRTEIEMDDSPYKESDKAPPMIAMTSAHSESLKRYTKALADAKAFPPQSLDFKEVKPGFNGKSYVVNLADRFCSLEGRSHARQSAHMYLFVTRDGTWLKCYNEECRSKNSKLNEPNPPYITDLFPKEIEITEDICGGGESEDETPVMARARRSPGVLSSAALDGTNAALAEFFFERVRGRYMAAQEKDQQNLVWYAFRQPVWHTNLAYSWLMIDIKSAVPLFEDFARALVEEEAGGGEKKGQKPSVLALSTVKKLKTNSFKKDICKELSHLISTTMEMSVSDLPFTDRLNVFRNKHLIAFKNGVYDLKEHVFREGRPGDYFSFSTGYNYAEQADPSKTADLLRYYEQIQPEIDIREYLLKTMSTTIDGDVKEQKIYVWYGAKGEGSKSTNADMLLATLGEFGRKIPSSYLVQEQPSSENATNTMVLCRGRRLAVAEEFKQGATINDATCKQFTGTINVIRDNFSKQKNVENTTTLIAQTNCELRSQSGDQAINRRIEHIPFLSRFIEDPDPTDPRQFKKDKNFTTKFTTDDGLKLANFHILLNHYKLYQRDGLDPPPTVVQFRERFEAMSNPVGVWLKTGIIHKTGTNAGLAEMKRCYSAWYFRSYNVEPNTKNFQDALQQNSITVEVLNKKSCTSWVDRYDMSTGKSSRVKKKVSTQPAALDVELVDADAEVEGGNEENIAPVI